MKNYMEKECRFYLRILSTNALNSKFGPCRFTEVQLVDLSYKTFIMDGGLGGVENLQIGRGVNLLLGPQVCTYTLHSTHIMYTHCSQTRSKRTVQNRLT